jgi:protein O-mannosyl-transferase
MSRGSEKTARPEDTHAARSGAPASPAGEMPEAADSRPSESEWGPAGFHDRWTVCGVSIFLAAIVWVVFGQTLHYGFVNFDDDTYVYENAEVARGLTFKGVVWAFTRIHSSNWHPLTWISHMLDCQLYGLNPGGHHLTNVLLHAATAILLFLVLRRMTAPQAGALWRSAFVAAVFAIHPLRVESVAWVAERKDVLSGVFFMLTLWAYARYVGQPKVQSPQPKVFYGLVLVFFALGLMCKPMLVTLPFVLLLLDYWPLQRVSSFKFSASTPGTAPASTPDRTPHAPARDSSEFGAQFSDLVFEKLPLFGLAAVSCVITIFAQTEAIRSAGRISLPLRAGNALISYVAYLGQMFWPSGLAALYPFRAGDVGVSSVVLSLAILAGISTGVFFLRRRPYFLTGWLWYLILLAPVIGILQVGLQARADRYTYLPQIGLDVLLTWAVADLCAGWRHCRVVLGGCAAIILTALILCARAQTSYWRNSESLWTHTLACTSDNGIAHNGLGIALLQKGNVAEAIVHFQTALQLNPDAAKAHNNLGNALLQEGRVDEAILQYQRVLEINPDFAEVHYNLGNALFQKGRVDEAMVQYQKALEIKPGYAEAHYKLGKALLQRGRVDEAMAHYQKALEIKPDYAEAHCNLGNTLLRKGSMAEAIVHYQAALAISPDYAEALNNLAGVLATASQASLRNGNRAVELAQKANRLAGGENPTILTTLAAAYAEAGRFPEAVETAQRALQLARTQSNTVLANAIQSQLKLYQAGLPFHFH